MTFNKKYVKNIKFRARHFNFRKLHDDQVKYLLKENNGKKIKKNQWKLIDELYVGVLEAHDDVQVYRVFSVTEDRTLEIERIYYQINLEPLIMRYGAYMNWYSYKLNYNTNFDFRNCIRVVYYPHDLIITSVLPELKKYVNKRYLKKMDICRYLNFVCQNIKNWKMESLASINLKQFCQLYESQYSDYSVLGICDNYLRTFQLINKWGYKIKEREIGVYIDHLDTIKALELDLRSPKYICPKNLEIEHQHYLEMRIRRDAKLHDKRMEESVTPADEEAYKQNKIDKYNLENVEFRSDHFIIKPILNIHQVIKEAEYQHNCLFDNKYYKKDQTLLFTSTDKKGQKLETIEFNLTYNEIVQSRGRFNKLTDLHNEIVDVGTKQIANYILRLEA